MRTGKWNGTAKYILFLWGVLLFLILCFPRLISSAKIALLVCIILLDFVVYPQIRFSRYLLLFFLFQAIHIILKIAVGGIYGNATEALISSFRVDFVYSALFVVLLSKITTHHHFVKTTAAWLAYANIYIGLYNIIIALAAYAHINVSPLLNLDATANVGIHSGYSHVVSTNLSMSIITFPLSLFFYNSEVKECKKIHLIAALLCGFAMVLSGRRILWLCLGIIIVIYVFSVSKNPIKLLKRILLAMVVVALLVAFAHFSGILDLAGVYDRFIGAFGKGQNADTERTVQIKYLLDGFMRKPVFGNGAGATIEGFTRSETTPWAFEMSYHVLLFQSGLVGALLYFVSIIMLIKEIKRIKRDVPRFYRGCYIALLSALVANATNPYYGSSFDFAVFLFLPVAFAMGIYRQQTYSELYNLI